MKDLDPTIIVAAVSAFGLVITGAFGVLVAIITNKKEKTTSASNAADATLEKAQEEKEEALRERLLLRDEKIETLQQDNAKLKLENVDLRAELDRLRGHQDV